MCTHTRLLGLLCSLSVTLLCGPALAQPAHLSLKEIVNAGLGAPPKALDRSTPKKCWLSLVAACQQKRLDDVAHLLNLDDIPQNDQRELGALLGKRLCQTLQRAGLLRELDLDDTSLGPLAKERPTNYVIAAEITLPSNSVGSLWLRRFKTTKGKSELWALTRKTVSMIDTWHRQLVQGKRAATRTVKLSTEFKATNPREAARLFRRLADGAQYAKAGRLLDTHDLVDDEGNPVDAARLARRLALILDRIHPSGFGRLSNDQDGSPEKGIPGNEEQVAKATVAKSNIDIRLARFAREDGSTVWLFSRATVADINRIYDAVGYGWAGDRLPAVFLRVKLWGVQLWQWIGLLLGVVVAYFFGMLFGFLARRVLMRVAKMTKWAWDDELVAATRGPLKLIFFSLGLLVVSGLLALPPTPEKVVFRICKLFVILAIGWFMIRLVDVAGDVLHAFFEKRNDDMGTAMVPVARRIVKPIMVLMVGILALQNAGMNVAGLLAGLGIGGLALAMAAKTTVENMLGGITIAFDRPFKVGDFVKIGALTGTVEEVGLRSTRVRTLDRTVVTIPNSQMVDSHVENFAKRDRIRLLFTVGVQYDSTVDQLRYIIDEINRLLLAHKDVKQEGFRVRFAAFGPSSLDIEILCYISTTDYNYFTVVREELNMRIAGIVETAGAEFAFPSRTIYSGKASESDRGKAKAASKVVEERRAAGELTVPMIPEELAEKLRAQQSS